MIMTTQMFLLYLFRVVCESRRTILVLPLVDWVRVTVLPLLIFKSGEMGNKLFYQEIVSKTIRKENFFARLVFSW